MFQNFPNQAFRKADLHIHRSETQSFHLQVMSLSISFPKDHYFTHWSCTLQKHDFCNSLQAYSWKTRTLTSQLT